MRLFAVIVAASLGADCHQVRCCEDSEASTGDVHFRAIPPGIVTADYISGGAIDSQGFSGMATRYQSSNVNVYIVWYNNDTHPWSAKEQNLARLWVKHLSEGQWWTLLHEYPSANGTLIQSLTLVSESTVAEGGCTNFDTSACDKTSVQTAVTGGMPCDTNGLYLVLPSFTDITSSPGNFAGHNIAVSPPTGCTAPNNLYLSSALRGTTGYAGPNGDDPFDLMMFTLSHEVLESLTDGWASNGGQQTMDPCSNAGKIFVSNGYVPPSGQLANWTFYDSGVRYDFILQDGWSREQGGYCYQGEAPPSTISSCASNADCSWSKSCFGGRCLAATCSDGIKNGAETDVDCGLSCGANAGTNGIFASCGTGKHCVTNYDCKNGICSGGACN